MMKTKPHAYTLSIFAVGFAVGFAAACGAILYHLETRQHLGIVVALFLGTCIAAAFSAAALALRNNDLADRTPGRH